jgi:hypothetical protein
MPHSIYLDKSDSEAAIPGFQSVYIFYRDDLGNLMPKPHTWRTRISKAGPTGNIYYYSMLAG